MQTKGGKGLISNESRLDMSVILKQIKDLLFMTSYLFDKSSKLKLVTRTGWCNMQNKGSYTIDDR